MKKQNLFIAIATCAVTICACQKQNADTTSHDKSPIESTSVAARAEFSAILENILTDDSLAEDVTALILEKGGADESLSFDEIISLKNGGDTRIANISSTFCKAVISEVSTNLNKYPIAAEKTAILTKGNDISEDDLQNLDFELYIPYSEYHDLGETNEVTVIYAPEDEFVTETDGVKINTTGEKSLVKSVNDEYTKKNVTIAVLPKDTTTYTLPIADKDFYEELREWYKKHDGARNPQPEDDGEVGRSPVEDNPSLPDGLLTVNVANSETIGEEDILYTNIARVKVRNDSWCGFISNKLKLVIYRTSADYETDDNNIPNIIPDHHMVARYEITKRQIREGYWIEANTIFDDDWDLHEYDQEIFFCSEHNLRLDKADMSGNVTLGYSAEKEDFSAEAGISANFSFQANASILRANNELTRKSILATNMSDMGAGTYRISGNEFAIRNYGGVVDLVYNMYLVNYDK